MARKSWAVKPRRRMLACDTRLDVEDEVGVAQMSSPEITSNSNGHGKGTTEIRIRMRMGRKSEDTVCQLRTILQQTKRMKLAFSKAERIH